MNHKNTYKPTDHYQNLLPSEYSFSMQEAVKLFYGYVEFDELAEALMVTAESLTNAARSFGVTNKGFECLGAPEIEMAISAIQRGLSTNEVAKLYGINYKPSRVFLQTKQNQLIKLMKQDELSL